MFKKFKAIWIYVLNILFYLAVCIVLIFKKDFQSDLFWHALIIGNIWIAAINVRADLERKYSDKTECN